MVALLIFVAFLWFVGYVITCVVWPYRRCGRCKGIGRRRGGLSGRVHPCRRCNGHGHALRMGRHFALWVQHGRDA